MKKLLLTVAALLIPTAIVVAQVVPQPGPPTPIACAYNSSPVTLTSGQAGWTQCANDGSLKVTATTSGTTSVTQGTSPWVVSNGGTFAVQSNGAWAIIGITPTDRTITSATGSSQTLMNANAARHAMQIQNTGNANCGVNPTGGTAIIGGAGTLTLSPSGSYSPQIPTLSAVSVICTAGQSLYADEN